MRWRVEIHLVPVLAFARDTDRDWFKFWAIGPLWIEAVKEKP